MKKKGLILKILVSILVVFVISIVGLVSYVKWTVDANTVVNKSKETILSSNSSNKKALIIYQPARTDITSSMAKAIGDTLNKSGYEVTTNYPSEDISYDISKYEVIVFGTPIFMASQSPVLEKYIKTIKDFSGKKVLIFATGGDKKDTKAIDYLEGLTKGASKVEKVKLIKGEANIASDLASELIKE